MSRLIETIKCENGQLINISCHQDRLNHALREYIGTDRKINLAEEIKIPENCKTGLFRCRVLYSETIRKIEFIPHQIRQISSIRLIADNQICYNYKLANRKHLEHLFHQRGSSDDILIVKKGYITDSFSANVIFYDGKKWYTPDTPLLKGTQRKKLLMEGKISLRSIKINDIKKYHKAGLINAMQNMTDMPLISTSNIL